MSRLSEKHLTPIQRERASNVKLAVFDVDGIMTPGQLQFLANGQEVKEFNILDGLGIKLLTDSGVTTAVITGRSSSQVTLRIRSLGINHMIQGREDKLTALKELWQLTGYTPEETAYIGDDWPDLAAIRAVSFGVTVPNAHPVLKDHALWCTTRAGGQGAAREFCEQILDAQNKLAPIIERYL